jgi:asparagine synthase (glutamine-hydrolysing)
MDRPVRTFTVGFSDHEHLNELSYARRVADHFKTEHHEVLVDEKAMREYLPRLVHSQDEPIADWVCIPLYFVSRLVRDSGTTVVQVGEGSDEQFCGYRSYMAHLLMHRWFWRPYVRLPALIRSGVSSLVDSLTALSDRYDPYLDVVFRAGRDREPFWSGVRVFSESRKRRLIDRSRVSRLDAHPELRRSGLLPEAIEELDSFAVVRPFFQQLDRQAPDADVLARIAFSEFRLRLPELLLMRLDKIGMSVSVEARVPFLDHKLVELTMSLPMDVKLGANGAKTLLKQAVRDLLPDDVVDRPKMGFQAPMADWLRGEFGGAVAEQLRSSRFFEAFPARREGVLDMLARHRARRGDFSLYVWAFYNAVAWFDHWVDGSSGAGLA